MAFNALFLSDWFANAPFVCVGALFSLTIYVLGWRTIRANGIAARLRFTRLRVAAFCAAWCVVVLALASPLDLLAERALSWHMVQHILLTMIAPPLFWCATPAMPMLFGCGASARKWILAPILASSSVRAALRIAAHPLTGFVALSLVTVLWHTPALYTLALRDGWWHRIEHAMMLGAGLLFWLAIIAPFPYRDRWPRIALVGLLIAADLVNTVVSAYLAFASAPVYAWYADLSPAYGIDALRDQQLAAGLMWIPGSVIYLGAAIVIAVAYLMPRRSAPAPRTVSLRVLASAPTTNDLLRTPWLGAALRSSRVRLCIRFALLAGALLIVLDGIFGTQDAPMNLAGTIPWTHWRGVTVIALLALGNIVCMACPLIAPRSLLRKWISPTLTFPRALRSKWLAVGLVMLWLVAYEAFDLWSSPWATAMLILGFIVVATAVDLFYTGASFCRFICPIGQYNMLVTTVGTREVRAIDASVCARCETHDCLKGRTTDAGEYRPGCGLDLFMPKKQGNLDCTFCLDCVSACPHENIGILPMIPGVDLAPSTWRSQIGMLATRVDFGALAAVFSIGAIVNAAGMTAPVVEYVTSSAIAQAAFVVLGLCAGLALLALGASLPIGANFSERATRLALAAIPLGAALWGAHYFFHLVTGAPTGEAAVLRVLHDLQLVGVEPDRIMSCCAPPPTWLLPLELLFLSLGLSVAIAVHWWSTFAMIVKGARRISVVNMARATAPGALVLLILWAASVWVLLQPMEMRGTSGFIE